MKILKRFRGVQDSPEDLAQDERLRQAEAELAELQSRGDRAVSYLEGRRQRNHWSEGIEKMIRGEA